MTRTRSSSTSCPSPPSEFWRKKFRPNEARVNYTRSSWGPLFGVAVESVSTNAAGQCREPVGALSGGRIEWVMKAWLRLQRHDTVRGHYARRRRRAGTPSSFYLSERVYAIQRSAVRPCFNNVTQHVVWQKISSTCITIADKYSE